MNVSELLATISENMPSEIPDGSMINWINYLEDDIYSTIVGNLKKDPHISDDELEERTRYKPTLKTLDEAEISRLNLQDFGYRWLLLYEYYIYSQIALLREEFGKANNYIMLYNSMRDDFFAFYNSRYQTDRDWR
jgi:hypothetical protein